jgi:hypothetical protein
VPDHDPERAAERVCQWPARYGLADVLSCRAVAGGVVHHVWELRTSQGRMFLKVRGHCFARVPGIAAEPHDIVFEAEAIRLFGSSLPAHFPQVVCCVPEEGLLITSDVVGEGSTLEALLRQGQVSARVAGGVGRALCEVHRSGKAMALTAFRGEREEEFYQAKLEHKLRSRRSAALEEMAREMAREHPRQLILGDPSPKNIGVPGAGRFTFFDLDDTHRGNAVFDVGFLAGHFLLHALPDMPRALALVEAFLGGYLAEDGDGRLIKGIALGALQYRLGGTIIPYATNLPEAGKARALETIEALLSETDLAGASWKALADRLAGAYPNC